MGHALRRWLASPRRLGVTLAVALTGIAGVSATAAAASPGGMSMGSSGRSVDGDTLGWFAGHTVDFHYTKNFYCRVPPSAAAPSRCEAGAGFTKVPNKQYDPIYVVVPIGFRPRTDTLQCPDVGNCVDHPHTIDLSRVLGAGTGDVALPAHSHIVTTNFNQKPEWWDVVVVGVEKQSSWYKIVHAESYTEMAMLQRQKGSGVTADIPTNFFLYFAVQHIQGQPYHRG